MVSCFVGFTPCQTLLGYFMLNYGLYDIKMHLQNHFNQVNTLYLVVVTMLLDLMYVFTPPSKEAEYNTLGQSLSGV